ncbi:hypothetical protein WK78_03195 [Burkholderia cepacia]|uniref:hypothetical protein n=1 Tax=Burkholderia cepacia TaxID=292 RepID=UPI00076BE7B8|nr:hypothetical protein [Burkholderia cepacia]KVV25107.1 hypothetical protein WK78_03195 [Burkholderia cepacia]
MAVVTIDLGFGKRATLSRRTTTGAVTVQQRQDAGEFLRNWANSTAVGTEVHNARNYVQQLGLHVTYTSTSSARGDSVAQLKAAVQSGQVVVAIDRPTTKSGGGVSAAARPQQRAMLAGPSYQPYSDLAADGGASMFAPLGGIVSAVGDGLTSVTADAGPDLTSLLGDVQPFDLGATPDLGAADQLAGVFLSPAEQAECEAAYAADVAECEAYAGMDKSFGPMCYERASQRYSRCLRGLPEL